MQLTGCPASQIRIVRDDENGLAKFGQSFKEGEDRFGCLRVEIAGRLIGGEDGWVGGEGARNRDALLLSAREFGGEFIGLLFDLH